MSERDERRPRLFTLFIMASLLSFVLMGIVVWLFVIPFIHNHSMNVGAGHGMPGFNERMIEAAYRVKPAVVSIISLSSGETMENQKVKDLGSGILFEIRDGKALVVTNQHVIEGAEELEVVLADGEKRKAELIGFDQLTDLAILQIAGRDIQTLAQFGDSDQLQAGESAIAIGNSLGLGYSQTITSGIISVPLRNVPVSVDRNDQIDWETDLIQTDAAINRGNSGGPLVNLDGLVIGINSLKVSNLGVEGLGFAIPSNQATEVIESLLQFGRVKRPFIGVSTTDLDGFLSGTEPLKLPDGIKQGVIVLAVEDPAKEAGLMTGDIITRLDEHEIDSTLTMRQYLYWVKEVGDVVNVSFYRQGEKQSTRLILTERIEE